MVKDYPPVNPVYHRQFVMTDGPPGCQATYWQTQAQMWHENYKAMMHLEPEHQRYKAALEQIARNVFDKGRCAAMAKRALLKEGER